jgi:rubrerythrin
MEMASIAFYQGIREVLPGGGDSGKVEHIISEEMRHVTMLTEKLFVEETATR